jgi:multimeric flavodoxin WrbA
MERIRILGISSSPRVGSNTTILVNEALKGAMTLEGTETKFIPLGRKRILPCVDCNRCNVEGTYCVQKDDMQEIYEALIWADGMILGTPVYYQTLNAQMKIMMERCRPICRKLGDLLRFKVGGAIAVGGGRNHGQEYAISVIQDFFNIVGMATVGGVRGDVGVAGVAHAEGDIREDIIHSEIYGDIKSEENAFLLGKLVATCTKVFREGSMIVDPDDLYDMKKALSKQEG